MRSLKVWDLPTRLFHWVLVLAVLGLVISGSVGGSWMTWHLRLGYLVLGLLLFRLAWGLLGGHWSRFSAFMYSPASTWAYLRGQGHPAHQVGHNPLGALSVFAMLLVLTFQVGSGLFSDDEIAFFGPFSAMVSAEAAQLATRYHTQVGKWLLLGLVLLHVAAVAYHQLVKREALLSAMWHGCKQVQDPSSLLPASLDTPRHRCWALLVATACGGLAWWIVSLGQL